MAVRPRRPFSPASRQVSMSNQTSSATRACRLTSSTPLIRTSLLPILAQTFVISIHRQALIHGAAIQQFCLPAINSALQTTACLHCTACKRPTCTPGLQLGTTLQAKRMRPQQPPSQACSPPHAHDLAATQRLQESSPFKTQMQTSYEELHGVSFHHCAMGDAEGEGPAFPKRNSLLLRPSPIPCDC